MAFGRHDCADRLERRPHLGTGPGQFTAAPLGEKVRLMHLEKDVVHDLRAGEPAPAPCAAHQTGTPASACAKVQSTISCQSVGAAGPV